MTAIAPHIIPGTLWIITFAISIVALRTESRIQIGQGRPIGAIIERRGRVQVRDLYAPIWTYAAQEQKVYHRTVVATGGDGAAKVQFDDGHMLELAPETSVILDFERQETNANLVVTLVKGTVGAIVPPKNPERTSRSQQAPAEGQRRASIKVQGQIIDLPKKSALTLVKKDPATALPVVHQVAPSETKAEDHAPTDLSRLMETLARKEPHSDTLNPAPLIEIEPNAVKILRDVDQLQEVLQEKNQAILDQIANEKVGLTGGASDSASKAQDLLGMVSPQDGDRTEEPDSREPYFLGLTRSDCFWARGSFSDAVQEKGRVPPFFVRASTGATREHVRHPRANLYAALTPRDESDPIRILASELEENIAPISLTPETLSKAISTPQKDPRSRIFRTLSLKVGVLQDGRDSLESPPKNAKLCAFSDQKSPLMKLTWRPATGKTVGGPWFQESPGPWTTGQNDFRFIASPESLGIIVDKILATATAFQIDPLTNFPDGMVYAVNAGRIIGAGSGIPKGKWDWQGVGRLLNAEYFFRGSRHDLIPADRVVDPYHRQTLRKKCSKIYFYDNQRLAGISWNVIEGRLSETPQFLAENASGIFCRKVEIFPVESGDRHD